MIKMFLLKVETTNMFHHLKQKHTREYNQAMKEEIPAAGDVQHKNK